MPKYPPLLPYFDGVKDLLAKYPTNEFNPTKGADLLTKKGWKKGSDGFWVDDKGQRVKLPDHRHPSSPTSGRSSPSSSRSRASTPSTRCRQIPATSSPLATTPVPQRPRRQHRGPVLRPCASTWHRWSEVPGSHAVNRNRWYNDEFDEIVDEMARHSAGGQGQADGPFHRAMEIWLPELPDIQITEWYHRIAMNTTYWKNWPTKDNAYVNGRSGT